MNDQCTNKCRYGLKQFEWCVIHTAGAFITQRHTVVGAGHVLCNAADGVDTPSTYTT